MKDSRITKEITIHIADLIKIAIPESEIESFREQLEQALDPAKVLNELNTDNVDITSQTVGTKNIYREDEVKSSLSNVEALQNASSTEKGYIVVKRFVDNE